MLLVKYPIERPASSPPYDDARRRYSNKETPTISFADSKRIQHADRVCSQCLRWSLTSPENSRASFKDHGHTERIRAVEAWGFPVRMLESDCPLCRLFALHAYDYAPQNFPADGMRDRAYSLFRIAWSPSAPLLPHSPQGIPKQSFWYLDPASQIRSNMGPLAGEGACIGKVSKNSTGREVLTARRIDPKRVEYAILRTWLDECNTSSHHISCHSSPSDSLRALTLIDCLLVPPQLISGHKEHRYAALSYVWGRTAVGSHTVGDELRSNVLPQTIQDAMTVTRQLGLRYLWIDRYCIGQDEVTMQDQISNMDQIFTGAEVTIIGASGPDINHGLPGISSRHRKPQPSAQVGEDLYVSLLTEPATAMQRSTWWKRAWCFQEALLSRRRLVFTEEQTFFQCQNMLCVESLSLPFSQPTDLPQASPISTTFYSFLKHPRNLSNSDVIYDVLEAYAFKGMTFETDGLRAIAGVLRAFGSYSNRAGENLSYAGLPLRGTPSLTTFVRALLWESFLPVRRRAGPFPSWSWVGFVGSFRFVYREGLIDEDIELRIVESEGSVADWDNFVNKGQLQATVFPASQYIHLHAWTASVQVVHLVTPMYQYGGAYAVPLQRLGHNMRYSKIALNYDISSSGKLEPEMHGQVVGNRHMKCVMIRRPDIKHRKSGIAILLRPIDEYYERIGTFSIDFIGQIFDSHGTYVGFHVDIEKGEIELLQDVKKEWVCLG